MRVLFVYPNLQTQMGFNHGLASISAVLKQGGHETSMVNLNEKLPPIPSFQDLADRIREWQPGMVAFSCITQQYQVARELAAFLHECKETQGLDLPPLVVGGIHPTLVPADVMADGVWDFVGMGECELALLELAEALERGEKRDDYPNFLCWKDGVRPTAAAKSPVASEHWVHNKVGEFPELKTLPEPDYDLFETDRITASKGGWFSLMSSRGCPYRCSYCLNHKIIDLYREDLGRSVGKLNAFRFRPADLMMKEIYSVLERFKGINTFIFDDDLFTQNVEHALEMCAAYEASDVNIPFVVNAHVKRLDPRVAEALATAGAKILKMGIECGSQRVRSKVLKRHMTKSDIIETVESAEEFGLHTSAFVMIGLPTETRAERLETVDILAESQVGRFRSSYFFPFPGTDSWQMSIDSGQVDVEQLSKQTTFTEESALDFGDDENLFIAKLGRCLPWFVNARMDDFAPATTSARYKPVVARLLAMGAEEWATFAPTVVEYDAELSRAAVEAGELHYAIRYNDFMGVRSDFFLAEEEGR
ncbi:MAG: anaerobic magnesium-protoporphyrin IX monomethyl ester cyclase, partial [Planctomycetota bacterium]